MANTRKGKKKGAGKNPSLNTLMLGEFAHQVIAEQFRRIVKYKKGVLADKDPEQLHQMRVGTRRLRTALQVFASAVKFPKTGNDKQLRNLARVLGDVRDLDVQTASLSQEYQPNLNQREQKKLSRVTQALNTHRKETFATMESALTQREFQQLKTAYESWLKQPQYTPVAQLSLSAVLPDVLSPLLSELFLHPGWLIATTEISDENAEVLHDLRKVCKHVRYQTEFFTSFYGEEFGNWVKEVKKIQDNLGVFQDTQVLQALLKQELGQKSSLPELQRLICQQQGEALADWEDVRQKYLDSGFRYYLHELLLRPVDRPTKVHPELLSQGSMTRN